MGDHDGSLYPCDDRRREVRHIMLHLSGHQRINHGLFIYQQVSCEIQDYHAFLHQAYGIGIDHAYRVCGSRHMDGNEVALFIQFIYRLRMDNIPGQPPCRINGYVWIIAIDIHSQMHGRIGHQHADSSKSDDSQLLSFQFAACECFLGFFRLFYDVAVFFVFLHPVDAANDVSGSQQHSRDHQFLHAVGVSPRRIEYHNALFCAFIKRDIVHPRACSCYGLYFWSELHLMHVRASYKDGIRILRISSRRIIFRKLFHTHFRYLI